MLATVSLSDWASSYASQGNVSLWHRVDRANSTHRQVRSLPIMQRDVSHCAAETNAATAIVSPPGGDQTPSDSSIGFEACETGRQATVYANYKRRNADCKRKTRSASKTRHAQTCNNRNACPEGGSGSVRGEGMRARS